jgi:hypothetical protein
VTTPGRDASRPPASTRRTVVVLAVLLVAMLATAERTVRIRGDSRAFCAAGDLQYEYDPGQFFSLNSYADVHERLCLTPRSAKEQLADLRLRVTVQIQVSRDVPIFEPDSTWADVTVTVDGHRTTHRCDFPELSRMTPWKLYNGVIGEAGTLAKECRVPVPRGDAVTVYMTFHAVEVSGPHNPDSGPLAVRRHGGSATCTRGEKDTRCERPTP